MKLLIFGVLAVVNCQQTPPPTERFVGLLAPRHDGPPTSLVELNVMTGQPVGTPVELRIVGNQLRLDRGIGLAYDTNTRRMFALVDTLPESEGRVLVGVNPETGDCTVIGDTREPMASITFDSFGRLWAVTGKDGNNTHSLWNIEIPSARAIFQSPLPEGKNGEAITFSQFDGLLYRLTAGMPAMEGETIVALSPASPKTMRVEKLPLRFGSPNQQFVRQPMSAIFSPDGNLIIMSANVENTDFELHTMRFPTFQPINTIKVRDRYKGMVFLPPRAPN